MNEANSSRDGGIARITYSFIYDPVYVDYSKMSHCED
jgi:hypothetical protein